MRKINPITLIILCLGWMNTSISQTDSQTSIALTNLSIIDVEHARLLEHMTIIIEKDKILVIKPNDSIDLSRISKTIDLQGKYVIPGLIDSHVHLFRPKNRKEILTKLLYSGITSVRDMGGDARVYQQLNKEIEQKTLLGPDIYYSANVFGPEFLKDPRTKFANLGFEPGTAPWMRLIDENSNLEEVVSQAKEVGVTGLKVYSNVKPELLKKLSAIAHKKGLKLWSHSSIFPSKPSDAVNAKVDVLSHSIGMIFEKERTLPNSFGEAIRASVPQQDFKNTKASDLEFIQLFRKMKANDILFEPTLLAWSPKFRGPKPVPPKGLKNKNPTRHLARAANKMDITAMHDWAIRITRAAHENGVSIVAGTDFNQGIKWVQDEIQLLTECGLSNLEAIKAATLNNAKAIGIDTMYGSILPGKVANLVVLSKNPLEAIENIRTVVAVYKDGVAFKVKE